MRPHRGDPTPHPIKKHLVDRHTQSLSTDHLNDRLIYPRFRSAAPSNCQAVSTRETVNGCSETDRGHLHQAEGSGPVQPCCHIRSNEASPNARAMAVPTCFVRTDALLGCYQIGKVVIRVG